MTENNNGEETVNHNPEEETDAHYRPIYVVIKVSKVTSYGKRKTFSGKLVKPLSSIEIDQLGIRK